MLAKLATKMEKTHQLFAQKKWKQSKNESLSAVCHLDNERRLTM